jgi:hypothetical protein
LGRDNNHVVEWNFKAKEEREKEIRTHHNPDLGEVITFPLRIFFVIRHGGYTQMAFFSGLPSWESQNSQNWDFHHFGCP